RVPKSNALGDPKRGFHYLMQFLAEERLLSACTSIANAQAAFDVTLDYIRGRRLFGQAVADFQVNRFRMADMRTELDVAQVFVDACVRRHNDHGLTADMAARAKLFTSEVEGRVTDGCVQLHGGAGYMDEYAISRMYRNARASRIYAGSSEVMRELIARAIGLDPRRKPASPPSRG
ncbi:MAG: acyl-CoA dehydrogenase, partial [Gammaproteobacteria bacterium PRO9]|nr:acyl-CoA dehydrogenase [Gammaproteobacteria bacterium PRO9]